MGREGSEECTATAELQPTIPIPIGPRRRLLALWSDIGSKRMAVSLI
jgi:hypothetical protein